MNKNETTLERAEEELKSLLHTVMADPLKPLAKADAVAILQRAVDETNRQIAAFTGRNGLKRELDILLTEKMDDQARSIDGLTGQLRETATGVIALQKCANDHYAAQEARVADLHGTIGQAEFHLSALRQALTKTFQDEAACLESKMADYAKMQVGQLTDAAATLHAMQQHAASCDIEMKTWMAELTKTIEGTKVRFATQERATRLLTRLNCATIAVIALAVIALQGHHLRAVLMH